MALARLREFLDANPALWRRLGDLELLAEISWLELIAQGEVLARESIRRESDSLREELLGTTATTDERLVLDQIEVLALEVQYLQMRCAEISGGTGVQIGLLLRRLDGAERRYVAALETRTLVLELALAGDARARLRILSSEKMARGMPAIQARTAAPSCPERPAPDRWFRSAAEVARPHTSCPGSWSTTKSPSACGRPIPRQRAPPSRVALVTPSKHPIIAPVVEPLRAVQGVIGNFGELGRRPRAHRRGGGHFCGRVRSRWTS